MAPSRTQPLRTMLLPPACRRSLGVPRAPAMVQVAPDGARQIELRAPKPLALAIVVWVGAIAGVVLKVALPGRFDRLSIVVYLMLGWVAAIAVAHGQARARTRPRRSRALHPARFRRPSCLSVGQPSGSPARRAIALGSGRARRAGGGPSKNVSADDGLQVHKRAAVVRFDTSRSRGSKKRLLSCLLSPLRHEVRSERAAPCRWLLHGVPRAFGLTLSRP